MPTRADVHISSHAEARTAGAEAASRAISELGGPPDLALIFATASYDQPELHRAVREVVGPGCTISGCSGEGVIAHGESREGAPAVTVMAMRFDGTTVEGHLVEGYSKDPRGCAATLAKQIARREEVVGMFVFADGLTGDCTSFLTLLGEELPGVRIVGGTSADDFTFERTFQYGNQGVVSGAIAAVVLRGRGSLEVAVSHGCNPIGPHQTITRAEGGWVQEIDGRPAWEVFKEYLDGDPQDLNAEGIVHLCIGTASDPNAAVVRDPMIIRTPLALDKASGALQFPGGGLRTGQRIRMTRRDAERIHSTAVACARLVKKETAKPAFVLQFDCAGRGKVMFGAEAADTIIAPLRKQIGESVPWAGFHTYGEIAPTEHGLQYHNYTVALCGFYD